MTGHITYKNKKLVAIITLPKDITTGKYPQKLMTAKPYETAKDLEIRMNRFIDQMESKNMKNLKRITFGNFMLQWLDKHASNIAPTTLDGYRSYINNRIVPALGDKLLNELLPGDIEDFYTALAKQCKRRTIIQIHSIISKAMKYANKNKMLLDNPMQYVDLPKQEAKYIPNIYDESEYKKLLDIVKGTMDEIYVVLAGGVGLRLSEIHGLQWSDVDFENKTLTIQRSIVRTSQGSVVKSPKNISSIRTMIVSDKIIDILANWKERSESDAEYIVNGYNTSSYSKHFRLLLKRHKLRYIRFHDLRHFNATYMLSCGVPDKVAADRLGHSTPQTTREIYQHVLKKMDVKAATLINDLFDTP